MVQSASFANIDESRRGLKLAVPSEQGQQSQGMCVWCGAVKAAAPLWGNNIVVFQLWIELAKTVAVPL